MPLIYREEALYHIDKSYLENLEKGPFFTGEIPPLQEEAGHYDFLGRNVRSRIGIFAGPLLNSNWVSLAARLGFDLLTYKTIRSSEYSGHALPNVTFVDGSAPFSIKAPPKKVQVIKGTPPLEQLAITNSFGMPSRSAAYLKEDILKASRAISRGQALIISFVGTLPETGSKEAYIDDFLRAQAVAQDAGARILEANFSCPNVSQEEGALYLDPKNSFILAKKLVAASKGLPLIIKVGAYPTIESLRESFIALAKAGVAAVSGINSYSMQVVTPEGMPALGPSRPTSGICGAPIRPLALQFTHWAREVIDQEKLNLSLIAGGGIVKKEQFASFFEAGADFVFVATGWMWDPYLALRYKKVVD